MVCREPERIWAVVPEGSAAPSLPDRADTNVLTPEHRLIGRDTVLERVERLLAEHRLVTLVGAGGSGKTRLAVELALRRQGVFPDGVWMVDLASVQATEAVIPTILSAIGASSVRALGDRRLLVVLDNCEHVVVGAAAAASALLSASAGVRVLSTSRRPLGLASEVVSLVDPLGVPSNARRLKELEVARSFRVARRTGTGDEHLVRGARGGRAADRPPARGPRGDAARHRDRGVPAPDDVVDGASSPPSRTICRRCVCHGRMRSSDIVRSPARSSGAFSCWSRGIARCSKHCPSAVGSISRWSRRSPTGTIPRSGLARLVDASLVVSLGDDRFRLLEPVRQHAEHRLVARDAIASYAERLARHMSLVVSRLVPRVYGDREARRLLRLEAGNIEQALGWQLEHRRNAEALKLFGTVGVYWHSEDQVVLQRWSERVTPLLAGASPAESASTRSAMGMLRQGTGDRFAIPHLVAARDGFRVAVRSAPRGGDGCVLARP